MAEQHSFILRMNRHEHEIRLSDLPQYLKDYLKLLWEQGIIIEVWGVVSKSWQPMSQKDAIWSGSKFYRLKGGVHYACQKERVSGSIVKYVYVTDPTALTQVNVAYMSEGRAIGGAIINY